MVTLTATVKAGASPVTAGQVNFCDASATSCSDIHLLGTVALTSSGTATFKFVPGPGVHSYKAMFVEDGYGMGSSSTVETLTVAPAPPVVYSDTTAITDGGDPGGYSLTATVVGFGGSASPTGNVSFLDTSFANKVLATAPLGTSTAGIGWLISQTPAASNSLTSEVTGDFNGDGIPDLAVLWLAPNSSNPSSTAAVTILFGKGNGTFTAGPTTQSALTSDLQFFMIGGDFNGDGKADLALLSYSISANFTDSVTTFLGKGDGTFTISAPSTVFNQGPVGGDGVQGSMVAADFNGDGKLDLAVVGDYINSGGVTIVLGNGDGTFTAAGPNLDLNADFGLIATGDFNGDGIPDLVATNYFDFGGGPTIFLGKGDGTFTAAVASLTLDYFPTSIVVGDFNGDGILDLAFSDLNGVEIALGNGDGTFKETSASPIAVPSELYSLVAGDFNHDGKLDLAGVENYDGVIDLLIGAGDGTFTVESTTPAASQNFPGSFSLVAADFNEDGVPDLAMLTNNVATASILLAEPTQTATATVNGIAPLGAGTHNVEASYAGDANYSVSVSGTVALTAGLEPVAFSPAQGTYTSVQTVKLTESVPGATIYYYAYGSVNTNGFVAYTAPIQLTEGGEETIQAYATETGYQQSNYVTTTYTLNLPAAPTPVFSPAPGSYPGPQTVTISDAAQGAMIYYTTNGSLPTTSSAQYSGPITVSSSETLVATAIGSGYSMSAAASAQYFIGSSPTSFLYTVAGNGNSGYSGDGGLATVATLNGPGGSVRDKSGNLYIADSDNNVIRKVAADTGVITTFAGSGIAGYSGDNGAATGAELSYPGGLSVDGTGNVYFADEHNQVVRMVSATTGVITTVAGNGTAGFSGDGGAAVSAELSSPAGTAVDKSGNLYIADSANERIRKVTAATGVITTVAGNGTLGYTGDGGLATSAELCDPFGVATDSTGNLYIADLSNNVIRKVNAGTGVISTVAGNGYGAPPSYYPNDGGYSGDGGPATNAELYHPEAVTVDSAGNIYIADTQNQVIRKVTASNGIITTVVGNGNATCSSVGGDGGPATNAALCNPTGVSVDSSGNLYIADRSFSRIQIATVSSAPPATQTAAPTFTVEAGTYAIPQTVTITDSTPGAAIYVTLDGSTPSTAGAGYNGTINVSGSVTIKAIAVAPGYLTSTPITAAYTITSPPLSVITTVAGNGVFGFSGAGGAATSAELGYPTGVAVDKTGNLYFTDRENNVIWEVSATTGVISIIGGTGTQGYSGDGGPATNAQFFNPTGIVLDSENNLYIADTYNNRIRKITASTGMITTVAGQGGFGNPDDVGDGGPATAAYLGTPAGLVLDKSGNLYIADTYDDRVRMVSASTGIISTVAGNGTYVYSGDGGQATSAELDYPNAVAIDTFGNLYISTPNSGRVRKVSASTGIITTIVGNGNAGSSGDGGLATKAEINPRDLAVDQAGNLYIADSPDLIREVSAATGIITKIAGNGYWGYSGDGGSATVAELEYATGIALDASGNIYIADQDNYRVRKVTLAGPPQITSVSPNYGAPAALIVIAGANFGATQGDGGVTVGGAPSRVVSWSNIAIGIQVPSRATTGDVVVTAGGEASNGVAFTFYPYPAITEISPASGTARTPVTVTGTGLMDGEGNGTVTFNGTPATILSQSGTSIQVSVPYGATTGPISVRANGDTVKSSSSFSVVPSPTISGISPNYGAPAALIEIAGTDFGATQSNGSVTVGGAPSRVVSWSNAAIAIQVPSRASTGDVVVTAGGEASNGVAFTFYPYPAISGISPLSGPVGTPVIITGAGLLDGEGHAAVTFNGTPATILSVGLDSVQVEVPAGASTGPVSIRVNGDTVKSSSNFTVIGPQISSISQSYGAPSALIEITGNNFGTTQGDGVVTVGGALSDVVSWSSTKIAILVPSRAKSGNIVVTAAGEASNGEAFTFYPYPAVTSVSPASGVAGTVVTITGTSLLDGGGDGIITFNGVPAAILSQSSTSIQVKVPAGATTGPITVRVNGVTLKTSTDFTPD